MTGELKTRLIELLRELEYVTFDQHPTTDAETNWRGCFLCDGSNQGTPHDDDCELNALRIELEATMTEVPSHVEAGWRILDVKHWNHSQILEHQWVNDYTGESRVLPQGEVPK